MSHEAPAPVSSADGLRRPAERDPRWLTTAVAIGLLALAAIVLGIGQANAPSMSPYDETTHEGYAWSIVHGTIPAKGDALPPVVLEDWACQKIEGGGETPDCAPGSTLDPEDFPNDALHYNYFHPPLYALITGLFAEGVSTFIPAVEGSPTPFLIAARIASILWIWAGLVTFYVALRRWAVDWRIAATAAVALLLLPTTLHTGTSVTNDAPFVLAGACALLLLARVYRFGRVGIVFPVVVTALAAATKILNAWVLLAVALVFFLDAIGLRIARPALPRGRLIGIAFSMVGAVGGVYVAWSAFQAFRGDPDYESPVAHMHSRPLSGLPIQEWGSTILTGLNPGAGAYLDPQVVTDPMRLWQTIAMVLLVAGTWIGLLCFSRKDDPEFAVALTALFGILLYPLIVQLQILVTSGFSNYFTSITTRYGASVLPVVIACWALVLHRRRIVGLPIAIAGVGVVLVVAGHLGIAPALEH